MQDKPKITTGANDRPRNESIGQTGAGLPDDSSRAPDVDEAAVDRVRDQLGAPHPDAAPESKPPPAGNPDAVSPGTKGSGENLCRRCAGTGRSEGAPCPDCGGSGKVTTPMAGG